MASLDLSTFAAPALQLLGGYLQDERADDRAQQNIDAQREFATHGVQWRVQDAIAAGVHPVFALGGSGAAFSPNPITVGGVGGALSSMGQDLSRAARAGSGESGKHWSDAISAATLGEIEARTRLHDAQAMAAWSQARRNAQQSTPGLPDSETVRLVDGQAASSVGPTFRGISSPMALDTISLEAAKQPSASSAYPNRQASVLPFLQEHRFSRHGETMLLPTQELGEILESAPFPVRWAIWAQVAAENWRHFRGGEYRQWPSGTGRMPPAIVESEPSAPWSWQEYWLKKLFPSDRNSPQRLK